MLFSVNYDNKNFVCKYLTPNVKIILANNFVMEIFFSKQVQNLRKILYLTCKFRRVRIYSTEIRISKTALPRAV